MRACSNGHTDNVRILLSEFQANIDIQDQVKQSIIICFYLYSFVNIAFFCLLLGWMDRSYDCVPAWSY